jgi:DNA mismatch repair protein MutL
MNDRPRPIRVLDDATIDRIAAGEVFERPASVVKELCENSLDAGARRISITMQGGGLTSLAIEDDGHGIPFRELPLAFERHATSKIASVADIMQVASFGFRGEALAAIASVSRCRMTTRADGDDVGGLIELDGGAIQRREPAPRNRGTTVTVDDLFYNTPARRKFMKPAQAERRAVVRTVTALALAHWEVRWQLHDEGETLLDLMPADSLPARAREILGGAVVDQLARFEKESGGFSVAGLASRPTWLRGNREQQFVYVNRRPVESTTLLAAIAQAYKEVVPPGKFPVVIAFLQVPPGEVDVNVHPAKTEVRMLLERQVFSLLKQALQEGLDLRASDHLRPFADLSPDTSSRPVPGFGALDGTSGVARAEAEFLRDHFQRGSSAGYEAKGTPEHQGELFGLAALRATEDDVVTEVEPPAADASLHPAPYWQLHRTYIVTQIRGGLVLIDQHNSHERILYNQAKQALEADARGIPTQQLLFPAHLDLSPAQLQAYHQRQADLARLGFLIQPFGGQSILVQGIPASLKNWQEGRLLLDVLDDLALDDRPSQEQQVDLLASFACHGAIRAGQPLTLPEMQNLVDRLFATDLPLSCPHGRPTLVHFTLEELERRFGRRT